MVSFNSFVVFITIFTSIQTIYCFMPVFLYQPILDDQPIFAHVVFRHGERNIVMTYPNDPYKDEKYWPGGYGALTNRGKSQEYELGKYLRRRYRNIIGKNYSPKEVYIRSSDTDRSLMSAQCNLAGLFPPSGQQRWLSTLNWQPIPVHIKHDLLYPLSPCDRSNSLFQEYMQSQQIKSLIKNHTQLFEYLQKYSGFKTVTLLEVSAIYDSLSIEKIQGFPLQKWADKVFESDATFNKLLGILYAAFTHTTEMKKLRAGFIIKDILDRFKQKSQSLLVPNRSLWMDSSHDLTIANLLNALGLYDCEIPPHASSLIFELYERKSQYYIQVVYRKNNEERPAPLQIPNCGTMCPLDTFYKLYDDILPTDSESFDSSCLFQNNAQIDWNLL